MSSDANVMYPIISDDPAVQGHYEWMRDQGQTHRWAEMCALRSPPRLLTDAVYFQGYGTLARQFEKQPEILEYIIKVAKRNGYTPNINDVYSGQVAKFLGDPEGFISPSGGRGEMQRKIEARGASAEGVVTCKYREPENPPEPVRLANDLVEAGTRRMIAQNPEILRKATVQELREEIIHKHGAKPS